MRIPTLFAGDRFTLHRTESDLSEGNGSSSSHQIGGRLAVVGTRKVGNLLNVCVRELGVWHVVPDNYFG